MSVKNTHPDYDLMAPEWARCRDVAIGQRAIHAKREDYLPRLSKEEDDSYNLRLRMTTFFNASWRTIAGLRGMLFRKPPTVDAPQSILDAMKNIDLSGTSMHDMAQEVAEEALTVGRVGLMVDYPQVPDVAITQADVNALGLRAKIVMYKAESIINWKVRRANGSTSLAMVVLLESENMEGKTEFDHASEARYRVLDLHEGKYRQRVFKIDDKNDGRDVLLSENIPLMNNKPLPFIPFVFIGVDHIGPEVDDPPLADLINTNLAHYGQATSYERGCFFSGLPTMFISGYDEPERSIYIGGNIANSLPNADAKAYYVEVQGNFEALRMNLEDKKREMAVLGARMLEAQKMGVEAADAIARRQNGEESFLSAIAQTISKGLTQALDWFSQWQRVDVKSTYEINRDFVPIKMDSPTLIAMVSSWQQGAFSKETLFDNLKQGEIIADDITFEEEEARIEINPPGLGMMEEEKEEEEKIGTNKK